MRAPRDFPLAFVSRSLALREVLPIIGKLQIHRHIQTTARYGHHAPDSVKPAPGSLRTALEQPRTHILALPPLPNPMVNIQRVLVLFWTTMVIMPICIPAHKED